MKAVMKAVMQPLRKTKTGLSAVLLAAALTTGLSACSNIHRETGTYDTAQRSTMSVAVVPFENFTNHHNAGMVAAEITVSELRGRKVFAKVISMNDVREAFEKKGIKEGDRIRNTQAAEICRLLGVDAMLIGSVAEYGYQYGLREEPSVTYNMRLLSSPSDEILWTFSAGQVGRGVFSRESVSLVAFSVIEDMVDALMGQTFLYQNQPAEPQQDSK